jgi:hypothetical protein
MANPAVGRFAFAAPSSPVRRQSNPMLTDVCQVVRIFFTINPPQMTVPQSEQMAIVDFGRADVLD